MLDAAIREVSRQVDSLSKARARQQVVELSIFCAEVYLNFCFEFSALRSNVDRTALHRSFILAAKCPCPKRHIRPIAAEESS